MKSELDLTKPCKIALTLLLVVLTFACATIKAFETFTQDIPDFTIDETETLTAHAFLNSSVRIFNTIGGTPIAEEMTLTIQNYRATTLHAEENTALFSTLASTCTASFTTSSKVASFAKDICLAVGSAIDLSAKTMTLTIPDTAYFVSQDNFTVYFYETQFTYAVITIQDNLFTECTTDPNTLHVATGKILS